MRQRDFVVELADLTGITQRAATKVVAALPKAILAALREGGKLHIGGLGVFRVASRKPRLVTPPQGGHSVSLPASKTVKFRAAKKIKGAL